MEILDYNEKYEIDSQTSSAYNLLGNVYNNQLKYDLAIDAYQKALDIVVEKSQKDPHPYLQIAGGYINLGHMHRLTNLYNAAYDDYNKARNILRTLVIQDSLQNSEHYIHCLYNLSNLCKEMKKHTEAEECIFKNDDIPEITKLIKEAENDNDGKNRGRYGICLILHIH